MAFQIASYYVYFNKSGDICDCVWLPAQYTDILIILVVLLQLRHSSSYEWLKRLQEIWLRCRRATDVCSLYTRSSFVFIYL